MAGAREVETVGQQKRHEERGTDTKKNKDTRKNREVAVCWDAETVCSVLRRDGSSMHCVGWLVGWLVLCPGSGARRWPAFRRRRASTRLRFVHLQTGSARSPHGNTRQSTPGQLTKRARARSLAREGETEKEHSAGVLWPRLTKPSAKANLGRERYHKDSLSEADTSSIAF